MVRFDHNPRRTQSTIRVFASNLLVNGAGNRECDSSLKFGGVFEPIDVVADDVFSLVEFSARLSIEQLRVHSIASPAVQFQNQQMRQLLDDCVLERGYAV